MDIKIEAKVLGMKNGHITEITIDEEPDRVFVCFEKKPNIPKVEVEAEVTEEKVVPEIKEEKPVYELGPIVGRIGKSVIHKGILEEVENSIALGKGYQSDIIKIIKLYRPNLARSSIKTYASIYRKYIIGDKGPLITTIKGVGIREKVLNEVILSDNSEVTLRKWHPEVNKKTLRKYKNVYDEYVRDILDFTKEPKNFSERMMKMQAKRSLDGFESFFRKEKGEPKPTEIYAVNKKYHVNITGEDYTKVRRAVTKWNFEATSFNIQKETGLPLHKVRAILDFMVREEKTVTKVKKVDKNRKNKVIYYPSFKEE